MKKPWKVLAAGIVISTALAGCGTHHGELGNKNIRNNAAGNYNLLSKRFADDGMNEMNRVKGYQQNGNNIVGNHQNYHLSTNKKLSDELNKLPGVRTAHVFTTDKNAYVAIGLDGHSVTGLTSTGRTAQGYSDGKGIVGGMERMGADIGSGVRSLANDVGMGARALTNDVGMGARALTNDVGMGARTLTNDVKRGARDLTGGVIGQSNYGTFMDRPGSNGYSSYTNGFNAYGTGASTNNRGHMMNGLSDNNNRYMDRELTSEFKAKVADIVHKNHPGIQNVYVSANPDFFSRMQGYANDVKQGHPIKGFVAEFNAMVERVFPAESASNSSYKGMSTNTNMNNGTRGSKNEHLFQ